MIPQNPRMKTLIATALSLCFTTLHASPTYSETSTSKPGEGFDFSWDTIKPSSNLVYHPCFDKFECAKLQVPLDWLSTKPGANASIAIIKLSSDPTAFPEYGKKWGGPVLMNPGGPGGSGVGLVLGSGAELQQMIGKQYSIIGFDPRNVNNTRPRLSCFDDPVDRILWDLKSGGRIPGSDNDSQDKLGEVFVRGKIFAELCTSGKNQELGRHLGTASVARDMLAITEASWDLAKTGVRKGLQYYGFSYGTALGMVFATLFPDKIERMVLDGVLNVFDWFAAEGERNMENTEDVMDSFYEYCSRAGPLQCAFHRGKTPDDIRERHMSILGALRTQPLAYNISSPGSPTGSQPDIFTYDDLRYLTFQSVYTPLTTFPAFATLLNELDKAIPKGSLSVDMSQRKYPLTCAAGGNYQANEDLKDKESMSGILCSDFPLQNNLTIPLIRQKMRRIESKSPTIGAIWAMNLLQCTGWKSQAKWKAELSRINNNSLKRKGGAPILLIGNTADPVTPLIGARAMAKEFPKGGAYVAVQQGEGHCSIASPSLCMMNIVGTYFAKGTVPKTEEAFCAQQYVPFLGEVTSGNTTKRDQGEIEAREIMGRVGRAVHRQLMNTGPLAGNARLTGLILGDN